MYDDRIFDYFDNLKKKLVLQFFVEVMFLTQYFSSTFSKYFEET